MTSSTTTTAVYTPNLRRELASLTSTLSEPAHQLVRDVAAGAELQATDEVLMFALQHLLQISPTSDYGKEGARHLYVHSRVVTDELCAFERFTTRFERMSALERRQQVFYFNPESNRHSSLCTLQTALDKSGCASLDACTLVDSLYLPIFARNHCSLLVYSVPRRVAFHVDSLRLPEHEQLAQRVVHMLLAAHLLEPNKFRLDLPRALAQRSTWECVWCVALVAEWWRASLPDTAVRDVLDVRFDAASVRALCARLVELQEFKLDVCAYAERLQRSFHVLCDRRRRQQQSGRSINGGEVKRV